MNRSARAIIERYPAAFDAGDMAACNIPAGDIPTFFARSAVDIVRLARVTNYHIESWFVQFRATA